MILDKIKKLQQKPVQTRKKIAFGISAGVTIIIFLIWLSVFNLNSNNMTAEDLQKEADKNLDLVSPFSKIKKDLTQIFEKAPEKFENLKSLITPTNSPQESFEQSTSTNSE